MASPSGIGKAVQASFGRVAEIAYLGDWVGKYCFIVAFVQVASAAFKVAEGVNSWMNGDRTR
jgi:hypothetical protein